MAAAAVTLYQTTSSLPFAVVIGTNQFRVGSVRTLRLPCLKTCSRPLRLFGSIARAGLHQSNDLVMPIPGDLRFLHSNNVVGILAPPQSRLISCDAAKANSDDDFEGFVDNLLEYYMKLETMMPDIEKHIKSLVGESSNMGIVIKSLMKAEDSRHLFPNCKIPQGALRGIANDLKSSMMGESTNDTALGKLENTVKRVNVNEMFAPFSPYESTATMAQLTSVILDCEYCPQCPVNLTMVRKVTTTINGDYVVSDQYVDKTIKFYVTRDPHILHEDFVLCDSAKKPLATIRKKILTAHEKWQVYKGHNTDDENQLFSVKKCSIKHSTEVDLNVFLPYNITEDVCDFKIAKSCFSEKTCEVYMGDNIIAQIEKKHVVENIVFGQDKLMLYVYSYVDHALIVALSVILSEMDYLEDRKALPSILIFQLFQCPINFLARLLRMFIAPIKFQAQSLRMAIISDPIAIYVVLMSVLYIFCGLSFIMY